MKVVSNVWILILIQILRIRIRRGYDHRILVLLVRNLIWLIRLIRLGLTTTIKVVVNRHGVSVLVSAISRRCKAVIICILDNRLRNICLSLHFFSQASISSTNYQSFLLLIGNWIRIEILLLLKELLLLSLHLCGVNDHLLISLRSGSSFAAACNAWAENNYARNNNSCDGTSRYVIASWIVIIIAIIAVLIVVCIIWAIIIVVVIVRCVVTIISLKIEFRLIFLILTRSFLRIISKRCLSTQTILIT